MSKSSFVCKKLGKECGKLLSNLSLCLEEIHPNVRPKQNRKYLLPGVCEGLKNLEDAIAVKS